MSKNIPNNAINSAGALKRDTRDNQFVSTGMRTGGSPITNDTKGKLKTGNQLTKANNFFGKETTKTTNANKSPKNTDFSKKILNKGHTDKSKDAKKPFNLQFNEYMNKQKNMNLNFLHSGKTSNNNGPSYYKLGYPSKNYANYDKDS